MAEIKVNRSLLEALPEKHRKHYQEILLESGVLKPGDRIVFDPGAAVFSTERPKVASGWGQDDPHHIACVDGCLGMFELAYNACMAQGGPQSACGDAANMAFDACVTTMCGAKPEQ